MMMRAEEISVPGAVVSPPVTVVLDEFLPFYRQTSPTTFAFVQLKPLSCALSYLSNALIVGVSPPHANSQVDDGTALYQADAFVTHRAAQDSTQKVSLLHCAGASYEQIALAVQTASKYDHDGLVFAAHEWPPDLAFAFENVFHDDWPSLVPKCFFCVTTEAGREFEQAFA